MWPLKWKYSATVLAFQAPPDAVTMPVTRYGKIPGRISFFQRSIPFIRKTEQHSLRSVGSAMAPAITLNSTYHCVPSSSTTMEAMPSPPPRRISSSKMTGSSAVAGMEADGYASGDCPQRAQQQSEIHTQKSRAQTDAGLLQLGFLQTGENHHNANHAITDRNEECERQGSQEPSCPWPWSFVFMLGVRAGEAKHQLFTHRGQRSLADCCQAARMLNQGEHPGPWSVSAFYLLDFEFFRPGDDWTPDELVEQHDHCDHGSHSPKHRARVAGAGRGLQVGAEAGQAKIARTEHEHFAHHQGEPSSGHRHHRVPDQADGGEGQLHLDEALPPTETVNFRGLAHLVGNAFERSVEAEGHVPHLPGED